MKTTPTPKLPKKKPNLKIINDLFGRSLQPDVSAEMIRFAGTNNPRHLRVLAAAMRRPMPREQVDKVGGCSNGPDLISHLRKKGLQFSCIKVADLDTDGLHIERGVYYLDAPDRRAVLAFFRKREARP